MLIDKIKTSSSLIAGLDIGTAKICVVMGEVSRDGISILSINSTASSGLKKGVVNDIDAAATSIRKAIIGAEKFIGKQINEVFAGLTGAHIQSFASSGSAVIEGKTATLSDVEMALEAVSDIDIPLDREIIQIVPTDFIIDGQGGIKDPVGMSGSILTVKVIIFTSAVSSTQNLLQCCNRAELVVKDIILHPLASALASITPQERESGVAVIDIGGGTTDIAIYKNGWLRHAVVLGIGGNHFTNDLSVVLSIPFQEAERIKINSGYIMPQFANEHDEIEAITIDGNKKKMRQEDIYGILMSRSEELLELIKREITMVNEADGYVSGAVLTGGASLLPGFNQLAEDVLSVPVRIGYPEQIANTYISEKPADGLRHPGILNNLLPEFNHPMYATGIGLAIYGAEPLFTDENMVINRNFSAGMVNKLTGWFKNIL